MAQNIQSLQLLRNNKLFTDKETAINGLTSGSTQDGVIKLARYQEDGKIKTIFGIYHATSDGSEYTIYDGDSEVIKGLTDRIDALEGKVTGDVASQISQAITNLKGGASESADTLGELEGLINTEVADRKAAITQAGKDASGYTDSKIGDLDATITGTGAAMNVVVNQTNGKIASVTVNDSNVATTGAVTTAKSEAISSANAYTDSKINGLDFTGIAAHQVVTNVTQTDGKITPTGESLGGVQLGAYTANTGTTGEIASTDSLATALNKITNKINTAAAAHDIKSSGKTINVTTSATGTNIDVNLKNDEHVLKSDGNAGLYTDIKLKKITTGLSANVQEEYQLVGSDGTALGDPVQIYKDSALLSVALLHASGTTVPEYTDGTWNEILPESAQTEANLALCYAYSDANGETQVVAVPVGSFLRESEFQDGLQVVGGVVSVKRDSTSENFLSVSENGVKLSGVQNAIDTAKNEAVAQAGTNADNKIDTAIKGITANTTSTGGNAVTVTVAQAAGKITAVTVNDSDVATTGDVTTAKSEANSYTNTEIGKLNATISGTGAAMNVVVAQAAGKITAVTVNDSNVATTGAVTTAKSEAISSANAYTDSTVSSAKTELQDKIDAVSGAVSSVTNAVTSVKMTGGTVNIADHQLTIDTDASQIKMDGYVKGSTGSIATADTINTAIAKLENKADTNASNISTNTSNIAANTTAIMQNKLTDASDGAIILGQPGDSGTSIKLGTLDAGTY